MNDCTPTTSMGKLVFSTFAWFDRSSSSSSSSLRFLSPRSDYLLRSSPPEAVTYFIDLLLRSLRIRSFRFVRWRTWYGDEGRWCSLPCYFRTVLLTCMTPGRDGSPLNFAVTLFMSEAIKSEHASAHMWERTRVLEMGKKEFPTVKSRPFLWALLFDCRNSQGALDVVSWGGLDVGLMGFCHFASLVNLNHCLLDSRLERN